MTRNPLAGYDPPAWMQEGICAQTGYGDLWFPIPGQNPTTAKKVCAACPVCEACLAYAIENGERGTWGGMTELERRKLAREGAAA